MLMIGAKCLIINVAVYQIHIDYLGIATLAHKQIPYLYSNVWHA